MVAYQFVLFAATGLLQARSSLQAASLSPIGCNPDRVVRSSDCPKAYAKIIYEADSTLYRKEGHIERAHGNCVVVVTKTAETIVDQKMVETGFKKMMGQCKDSYAYYPLPGLEGVHLVIRPRMHPLPIEDDAPFLKPVCLIDEDVKHAAVKADCMEAYKALTTDQQGRFSGPKYQATNVVSYSVKSCYVGVFTSDTSAITITRPEVDDIFENMLDECNGKWSGVPIQQGADGPNGRLFLIAAPIKFAQTG
ncbi:hypothetical protein MJO28_008039 [Puccinia striiformis f. sp. tritici]|uniref:Ecp2 effector protein domain-containing protein n=3 Tax=Puccinia striiformis TaxID=27350 RepID=A0A0L0VVQ1_9BASI|nr:hypothetical protein Pst134EA_015894 [Puccinia striiformis f. sp. tritici]KAI9602417.1 hypothetical protein H4Q26_001706 [Puccinia striiformis f. sp. tritici PST-130]KNF03358.1 hypothetical protein PSTG_03301 [Puccinia striiformis f. sp. tritici PST-78]POW00796.1 hypothetical protein PSTT_12892 [Puccinia striiformis]KAH9453038.1 hypothetical protein Pst134EB_016973 [Puccinia striiformis f. sp. tritici]KAH9463813.1 hypothetical protein Pst134EA_015894 [Puccinia striiformis f. sp. tritici]